MMPSQEAVEELCTESLVSDIDETDTDNAPCGRCRGIVAGIDLVASSGRQRQTRPTRVLATVSSAVGPDRLVTLSTALGQRDAPCVGGTAAARGLDPRTKGAGRVRLLPLPSSAPISYHHPSLESATLLQNRK